MKQVSRIVSCVRQLCVVKLLCLGLILFFVPLLTTIVTAHADTWYVKTNGSDSNGGTTWNDAFRTIQKGIDEASATDTVLVADGTYTGLGNKNLDFGGKAITVQSQNGPENCTIDCENDGRGFYFHSDETYTSVVDGFTITNGEADFDYGGGIYCGGGSPTITNCIITNCEASRGGGIAGAGGIMYISDCTITGNSASYGGGGVYLRSSAYTALYKCVIADNQANSYGGGVYCDNVSDIEAVPSLSTCTIVRNQADYGGGMYSIDNPGREHHVTNCTFSDNVANQRGGGIYCRDSQVIITNCILWGDSDSISSSGSREIVLAVGSHLTISYSHIWIYGIDVYSGATLVYDYGTNIGVDWTEPDPLFVGGGDYHLTELSPCIEVGMDMSYTPNDIDDDTRPQCLHNDIGSDEYVNACPSLSDGDVDPASGDSTTTFTFSVRYSDQDGDSPTIMNVVIDGTPHEMSLVSGSASNGVYTFETTAGTLDVGTHSYHFYFEDEFCQCPTRLPSEGTYSGPMVNNSCPTLTNYGFEPERGDFTTSFRFGVGYYDPDGHLPTVKNIVIDGTPHEMTNLYGGVYILDATGADLGVGIHTHYFSFDDGHGCTTRLPSEGSYTGPDVIEVNHCPLLTNADLDPDSGDTTTTFRFTVDYYDENGHSPMAMNVFINDTAHEMTLLSGSTANGTYYYDTTLGPETQYYFSFDDGYGCTTRLPAEGSYTGPTVAGIIYYVGPNGDYDTIQAALDDSHGGDTIILRDGTYTGADNKNLDFNGKGITLRSENGPANCIIDCEGDGRGFFFHSGESSASVVDGLTITNGKADYGGGIDCRGFCQPTITNCIITNCKANYGGGGVYCYGSYPVITNCIINGNSAGSSGGGIYYDWLFYPALIANCTIVGNSASVGGGIGCSELYAELTITNCILRDNSATYGPQLAASFGLISISYDNIEGGQADIHGTVQWGDGNIDADPLFVDTDGPDDIQGNEDDDFHLQQGSLCIDAGDPASDYSREPEPNGGRINIGAYGGTEEATPSGNILEGDFDGDGDVDGSELARFAVDFGRTDCDTGEPCEGDFDGDNDVDETDLADFAIDFGI